MRLPKIGDFFAYAAQARFTIMATTTKLSAFESALTDGYSWIDEVADELDFDDPHYALRALRAALHALRDRLAPEQAAHLAAQLPLLVKGVFYEDWKPAHTPVKERHLDDFLAHIDREFKGYAIEVDPEDVARSVYTVLGRHLSPGTLAHACATLPVEIRDLFIP